MLRVLFEGLLLTLRCLHGSASGCFAYMCSKIHNRKLSLWRHFTLPLAPRTSHPMPTPFPHPIYIYIYIYRERESARFGPSITNSVQQPL